ncbi:F-box only protein 21-like [Cydia amplana]|uniref:F-box only protein 21-like n=1 Tax=Cydia amplana TaxID=1869771 RepID=UPI002FE50212
MEEETCAIKSLPNEIITLILDRNDIRDILRFGATCKRFHDFVRSNQYLWKDMTKQTLPAALFKILEEYTEGDWLVDLKGYHTVKKQVYLELIAMSPQFYGRDNDINIQDVRPFFKAALVNRFSFNFAIYILQDVIRKGNTMINNNCKTVIKPFTLTEMHYAKIVLRHLIHTFLSLKWVRAHVNNELSPEAVCNFFIQWVDTLHIHPDEHIDIRINDLVEKVKIILCEDEIKKAAVEDDVEKQRITERDILSAVTQVVYHDRHMAITTAANLDTLDIVKVLDNKCGNVLVVTAIYQAVAKKCGVNCELIAFPNHLFLEWRDNSDPKNPQVYTVEPSSGELNRRRRCPFSQNGPTTNYRYCPDSLLQYICSSFHMSMGAIRNWNTLNALHLLDFLGSNRSTHSSYKNFLPYLLDPTHMSAMTSPLNLKHLSTPHIEIIRALSRNEVPVDCYKKRFSIRHRTGNVKYAVGMTCYHTRYDYVCIVRSWDLHCALKWQSQMTAESLYFGVMQPFYNVIAADQSERYVPQEFLKELDRPNRLYHLEEVIATEFTHFDGFAYVPNDEKRAEFPDDEPVVNVYRERAELLN